MLYYVTLKLKFKNWIIVGLKLIDPDIYANFKDAEFGRETISTIQLCEMSKLDENTGYYRVEHTIHL